MFEALHGVKSLKLFARCQKFEALHGVEKRSCISANRNILCDFEALHGGVYLVCGNAMCNLLTG